MSGSWRRRLGDYGRLLRVSARLIAGRRFWIAPFLPLVWIVFQIFRLLVQWRPDAYGPVDAQTTLIGFPLTVMAVLFGVRIIAGEIDRRTLEIAYTVPGGSQRVWLGKMAAALILLIAAEALLALATFLLCTAFPLNALYGALQAAVFYLVLSMGLAALLKSEAAGALVIILVLGFNSVLQTGNVRLSPFWNQEIANSRDALDVTAWAVQNRIGFALAIIGLTALAFARAERREKLLGG